MRIVPLRSERQPSLAPDLVWSGVMGDLAVADPDEAANRGGLRAKSMLETAVTICLMSDARADRFELRDGDVNRGWPGDTFDLDARADAEMGRYEEDLSALSTQISGLEDERSQVRSTSSAGLPAATPMVSRMPFSTLRLLMRIR